MSISGNFKEVKDAVSSALIDTIRVAGQISNEDLAFHRSSNPSIVPRIEKQNARLLNLAQGLTRAAISGTGVPAPHLVDLESVDDNWKSLVDVFDNLLEKADACLDEFTGSIKRLSPSQEEKIKKAVPAQGKQRPGKAYQTQNIPKPQLLFNKVPKNDEKTPFRPLLRSKPHALIPLNDSLGPIDPEEGSKQYDTQFYLSLKDAPPYLKEMIDTRLRYRNPYETEIKNSRYPPTTFIKSDPIPYLPYKDTKATLVDTPEAVAAMMVDLKQAKEIAIDLEHHDEHSYIGLVSLMQISTREKDWVVDTLKPWRQDLQILNEVFADPDILKVLHGAFMDIIWLQRDLGLYIVGLFDTFHASRALGYPRNSLAFLLKKFADFDAAKQYQMADWRIRPLPEEMFDYARSDTHFLLYIFDNMRNDLIDNSDLSQANENLVENVMNYSKEEALQRYEHPFYDMQRGSGSTGWYNMLCRTPALFTREQFAVFRAVHHWRDTVARQEDESVHLVMPKHVLYSIARETPMDMPSLLGCSHPMSKPFQKRKQDLLGIVRRAKVKGATGPEMKDVMQDIGPKYAQRVTGGAGPLPGPIVKSSLKPVNTTERPLDALPLRSDSSQFWGPSVSSSTVADLSRKTSEGLWLALPLPELTAEVFEDPASTSQARNQEVNDPGAMAEHEYVKDRPSKKDDVFIVKQDAGSQKRKSTKFREGGEQLVPNKDAESETGEAMEIMLNQEDSEAERVRAKKAKKAEKKHLKKEKKEQRSGNATSNGDGEIAAFDYTNAPSVLHPKRSEADRTAASKGVNPYAKSMDAPKGMRKQRKDIPGKSHTFKK